jgi:isoleucyl-tRNA synthetase
MGPKMAQWIKERKASEMRELLADGPVRVDLDGTAIELRPEDVVYTVSLPEGFAQAESGGECLLLDTRLDDDLIRQGIFREIVHRIQIARKDAGYSVTDRIVLTYSADPKTAAILEEHEDEIAAEVLAAEVRQGISGEHDVTETIDLADGRVTLGLIRWSEA